ncbi:MAG TPA: hypothetical protein VGD69_11265 [Herpetosiphonaceae bacterium]
MHEARPLPPMLQAIDILLRLGELPEAQQLISAIEQFYPDIAVLHVLRGWMLSLQEQPRLAAAAFRIAAGRDPLDLRVWRGLAAVSNEIQEQDAAAARADILDPAGPQHRVWHHVAQAKPHLALTLLKAFEPRFNEWPELAIWYAELLRRVDRPEEAASLIQPLLRRRPCGAPTLFLASALSDDVHQSQAYLSEALRKDPLGTSALRLFAPGPPPFRLPPPPVIPVSSSLAQRIDALVALHPAPDVALQPQGAADPKLAAKSADTPAPATSTQDSEVAAALQTIQEATRRLIGHAPLAADARPATTLLVTHHAAFVEKYGAATAAAIIEAFKDYGAALAHRGIHTAYVLLDQPESLQHFGAIDLAVEHTAPACKQVVDQVCASLEAADQHVDAIVLIGGDDIIPFHQLPNPSQDADATIPSDNPYGCRSSGSELAPDLIVARFPDACSNDAQFLIDQLRRATEYHRTWQVTGPQGNFFTRPIVRHFSHSRQPGTPVLSWGVTAAAWQVPSKTIYGELGSSRQLVLCPPATPDLLESLWPTDGRLLFFNLHGIQGGPNWYGQAAGDMGSQPLPIALTPDDLGPIAPAMICISEACYGAEIAGRTTRNAIALRLLSSGVLAFLGSTATAYGCVSLPLAGADLLTQQTIQNLRRGYPLGRAVTLARDWMTRELVKRQGYLDPDDAKTLLSFVILGDPWATPYARPTIQPKAAIVHSAPAVAARRPIAANLIAPAATHIAQQLIAKVVPGFVPTSLSALGQGRPDRIAKGQASAVVFSATAGVPTIDGQTIAQVVRVTVAAGEARKLLLSH